MKKGCLFILLLSGITISNAQIVATDIQSPAETFASRKGTIIEKRFDEVNKIGNLNVQIEYLSDLTSGDKLQCIRFDIRAGNNASTQQSSLLDTNEVNELIGFVKYITTNVTNRPPVDPNTEISFTTKYNFVIGCYWQSNNGWILFMRPEPQTSASEVDFPQNEINSVLRIFSLANTQIQRQ